MTVQRKQIAKGSKLLIGTAPGVTPSVALAAYGRVEDVELPSEDYEVVEVPELNPQDDSGAAVSVDPRELGDEIPGEMKFNHYWDPMHADSTLLTNWRRNKTELLFAFDSPHATTAARVTCTGRIKTLSHPKLAKKDYFKREVVVILTSLITTAAKP